MLTNNDWTRLAAAVLGLLRTAELSSTLYAARESESSLAYKAIASRTELGRRRLKTATGLLSVKQG